MMTVQGVAPIFNIQDMTPKFNINVDVKFAEEELFSYHVLDICKISTLCIYFKEIDHAGGFHAKLHEN